MPTTAATRHDLSTSLCSRMGGRPAARHLNAANLTRQIPTTTTTSRRQTNEKLLSINNDSRRRHLSWLETKDVLKTIVGFSGATTRMSSHLVHCLVSLQENCFKDARDFRSNDLRSTARMHTLARRVFIQPREEKLWRIPRSIFEFRQSSCELPLSTCNFRATFEITGNVCTNKQHKAQVGCPAGQLNLHSACD